MTQRVVMTPGNPKLSYRSATARTTSPVGLASIGDDDSPESAASNNLDLWPPELDRDRFPGWLRLAIIGAGAALCWGAIAIVLALLR